VLAAGAVGVEGVVVLVVFVLVVVTGVVGRLLIGLGTEVLVSDAEEGTS